MYNRFITTLSRKLATSNLESCHRRHATVVCGFTANFAAQTGRHFTPCSSVHLSSSRLSVCTMATQQQVLAHLRSILRVADLETVTEEKLKGQLTSHFSEDMEKHEDAIMPEHPTQTDPNLQTEVERFITSQAQVEAKGRKREQENCEPQPMAKQARTSVAASSSSEAGVFVLSPDGLQRCVVKEFKKQKYVDVRMYWKKEEEVNPTKKGLMMNPAEWAILAAALPNLQAALHKKDNSFTVNMSEFRRATIFEKGDLSVDIREWYSADDGSLKPGQKGVALSQTSFQALTEAASAITAHLGAAATSAEPFAATGDASARTAATPSGPVAGGATVTAADGTKLWKLGNNGQKHVSVGEFKGTKNVGLREYYEKDGLRPGKKGINLTVEQFNSLVAHAQGITEAVESKNLSMSVQLAPNRHVRLNEFKNSLLVDVREYYEAGGETKPGNKGLSMTSAQWSDLAALLPELKSSLQS